MLEAYLRRARRRCGRAANLRVPGSWGDVANRLLGTTVDEEAHLARREKGGFWVALTAVFFYPLSAIGKVTQRGPRLPREGGALVVMNHVSHFDPVVDGVFVH